jgi:LmbE family N-acetylglucosaminyl deacetylase
MRDRHALSEATMRLLLSAFVLMLPAIPAFAQEPLRVICFGAHPDDCELKAGGVAAMWAAKGAKVKFVSTTNGDIGHWKIHGPALAARRKAEVEACARILGIETQVLDIHDGELEPTLAHRKTITKLIRDWKADVVISPRPNDYHPDHRYTGVLVQDAAYMVAVPFLVPESPPLKSNPVFLFYSDRFMKPNPFTADIVIGIDSVIEKKMACVEALDSQFYEGGALGGPELIPSDAAGKAKRKAVVREAHLNRDRQVAERFRKNLADYYDADQAKKIEFVEAFEICEYGRRPRTSEIKTMFPFAAK